jgi:F0F1-type ATP synthase assembly protein I
VVIGQQRGESASSACRGAPPACRLLTVALLLVLAALLVLAGMAWQQADPAVPACCGCGSLLAPRAA